MSSEISPPLCRACGHTCGGSLYYAHSGPYCSEACREAAVPMVSESVDLDAAYPMPEPTFSGESLREWLIDRADVAQRLALRAANPLARHAYLSIARAHRETLAHVDASPVADPTTARIAAACDAMLEFVRSDRYHEDHLHGYEIEITEAGMMWRHGPRIYDEISARMR